MHNGSEPLTDLVATIHIHGRLKRQVEPEEFLNEDFRVERPSLKPGIVWEEPIALKFAETILSERERELTAEISITSQGRTVHEVRRALFVYGQNWIDWKHPERIVSFIDAEDYAVRELFQRAWREGPATAQREFPPKNLLKAVSILTALSDLGLRYLEDGDSATTFSGESAVKDRVQYPSETLLGLTGDCDDLSVLCCALLQAVKVPTVFVVAREHVLLLFDPGFDSTSEETAPVRSRGPRLARRALVDSVRVDCARVHERGVSRRVDRRSAMEGSRRVPRRRARRRFEGVGSVSRVPSGTDPRGTGSECWGRNG